MDKGRLLYVDDGIPKSLLAHRITTPIKDRPGGTSLAQRIKDAESTAAKQGFDIRWMQDGKNYVGHYHIMNQACHPVLS